MIKKDYNSCNLFKTQIYDNLKPFYLYTDGSLKSRFGTSSGVSLAINNLSKMTDLISSSAEEDVWTPAFMGATTNSQMPYIDGLTNRKPFIGIHELFVLSQPEFKDITISGDVKIGVDWFLNDILNSDITPISGLLFWYKKRGSRQSSLDIKDISPGEWIVASSDFDIKTINHKTITIPSGQICVKINNKELQVLPINKDNQDNTALISQIYTENNALGLQGNIYEPTKINLDTSTNRPASWSIYDDYNYLKVKDQYYSIHISDGDYFSYKENNKINYFLSFNLMHIYRTIYNNLLNTIGVSFLGPTKAKKLKQLAYILATGPQNDKVTININGIYRENNVTTNYISIINEFLNSGQDTTGLPNPNIITICKNIYKEIKDLEKNKHYNTSNIPYKTDISEVNNSYCKVHNDILHRVVSKYGLYLRCAGPDATITINRPLKWKKYKNSNAFYSGGPNVSVDTRYLYWTTSRDISSEAYSTPKPGNVGHPFYDQHIQVGPMKIQTDLNNQKIYFKSIDPGSEEATVTAEIIKPTQNPRWSAKDDNAYFLMLPEIKYAMFSKQGGFKIISSTCYIDEPIGNSSLYNGKLDNKPIFLDITKLSSAWNSGKNKEYHFNDSDPDDRKKVSIKFKLYNSNDIIKLDGIYINFLRYSEETLCNCDSFYREIINRSETSTKTIVTGNFAGVDIFEDTFKRIGFSRTGNCGDVSLGGKSDNRAIVPGVSTRFAPPIIAYGGYDPSIVAELGVSLPGHPAPGTRLGFVETRNPVYINEVKCYERGGLVQDKNYHSHTDDNTSSENLIGTTVFKKGFFHPHMGWIDQNHPLYNSYKNKTAVVTFSQHLKPKFTFKGVGFLLEKEYEKHTSTISINLGQEQTTSDEVMPQTSIRSLGGQGSKLPPEYETDECIPYSGQRDSDGRFTSNTESTLDNNCNNNYQPKINYNLYPLKDAVSSIQIVSSEQLQDIRIKDIEVKLNFLNFDNIQDIKLTLKYDNVNIVTLSAPDIYYGLTTGSFPPNSTTQQYITDLNNQNTSTRIVLLNREHIKQYGSDFVLRFSDYASPYTFHNPINSNSEQINYSSLLNNSLSDGDVIHPSFKPDGYTDRQVQHHRELLNSYNTNIISNKFRKWYGSPLLGSKFTLEIELTNQYNSSNYGNINDLHIKNNKDFELLKSNISRNSMCNWELVIDTYSVNDPSYKKEHRININHPTSQYINYTNTSPDLSTTANSYGDGYNFMGDFTDRKFLVPPVNMNAPHQYLLDFNSCLYPDRNLNNFGFSRQESLNLRFVSQAMNLLNAGIGAFMGLVGAGLSGGFVGIYLYGVASDLATRSIVNWFANQRRNRLVDSYDKTYYDPSYDEYGYGFPDRALVEVSDDNGATWYTFDANIFKYNKYCSPVYKPLTLSYTGAGDETEVTCSKIDNTSPVTYSPDYFSMPQSLIINGTSINYLDLIAQKNIKLNDKSNNWSNVFIGNIDAYDKDTTICIEMPFVKPFYYLNSGPFSISTNIDIIYYDKDTKLFSKKNKTISNINILNKNNTYNTYILFNDQNFRKLIDNTKNPKLLIQKSNAQDLLGINLYQNGGYLSLASIKSLTSNIFVPDYAMPVYGEGSWGRGSSSIELFPAKQIAFSKDYDLSNYAIGYSSNRYTGRIFINGNTITTKFLNVGLFDNVNGWPLYKNPPENNLYSNLSDNIHYPYKNISDVNSIFYLYTNTPVDSLKNKDLPRNGTVTLLDHLIPVPPSSEKPTNLEGCIIEVIYNSVNYSAIPSNSCYGNSVSNNEIVDISINDIFIFSANMSNDGYGHAPSPPLETGTGNTSTDRYLSFRINADQAQQIIDANPWEINMSATGGSNKIWVRLLSAEGIEIKSICTQTGVTTPKTALAHNDNKYWINIDKYQYGTYSRTTTAKVLNRIEYICSEPSTMPQDLVCKTVCGLSLKDSRAYGFDVTGTKWIPSISSPEEILQAEMKPGAYDKVSAGAGGDITLLFRNTQADKHKALLEAKYGDIVWEEVVYNRPDVRVSCGNRVFDTVMFIREYYWIAKNKHVVSEGYGNLSVRACDILESKDNILVRFKYNTRKLRHVDNFLKKYIIQPNGNVTYAGLFGTDEMPIKNSFYSWFCDYIERGSTTLSSMIPSYYIMLNEMIFRGFFGSADGLENKSAMFQTQYPHEWIPYEYDNAVQCEDYTSQERIPVAGPREPDTIGARFRCWLLSKLVFKRSDKQSIVRNCLSTNAANVPDKQKIDKMYANNDPALIELRDRFL